MTKRNVQYPVLDPRTEKGHYQEHWRNLNKMYSLDNSVQCSFLVLVNVPWLYKMSLLGEPGYTVFSQL